jgi:hypothetical protein
LSAWPRRYWPELGSPSTSQRDLSHDAWYGTYRRRVLRFLQGRSSVVLTNAKAIRDGLIEQHHLPPNKVCVVYKGVDLDRFHVLADRDQIFPSSGGNKLIVLMGNMITDNDLATRIAQAGHDYVNQNFSFERRVAVIDALYAKLLHSVN